MAKNNASEKMVINGRNMKITSGPVGTTASMGSRVFDVFNYLIIGIISITTILPFIYVPRAEEAIWAASLETVAAASSGQTRFRMQVISE